MLMPKRILVATDFGPASAAALRYGREFGKAFGAQVHVLHVIADLATGDPVPPPTYVQEISKAQSAMVTGAREELHAFIAGVEGPSKGDVIEVVATANGVAPSILAYAEEQLIDLIIVGHHGHGGLKQFLLGSVAEKVVRAAPCPVLTVRHPEREFVQPPTVEITAQA